MTMDAVTVLDLGSTKVVCLVADLTESGDLRVEATAQVGFRGLRKGVVVDPDEAASAIDEAVSRCERAVGSGIEDVAVAIGGAHIQSLNAQGFVPIYPSTRQIRRDDVMAVINHSRQVVLPADREQIAAMPREFRIDGQRGISKPIGQTGGRLEVVTHIVTGLCSEIAALDRAVTLSGRRVNEMVPLPLASGLGVAKPQELEDGCVVVDIGGGTTGVAVFTNGTVDYLSCLPLGGDHVTSDLRALLKVSPDEAERLKTVHGAALSRIVPENDAVDVRQVDQPESRPMQRRVLCEIIESRMREIARLVARQVEQSGIKGPLPAGVVLTGGGSLLSGVDVLFAETAGLGKARVGSPKTVGPNARTVEVPTMATAVGLAKYCLESDEQEFAPVSGFSNWKEKIRTLKNPFVRKG